MFDPYSQITQVCSNTQLKLSESLELRASDPEMRDIINSFLSKIRFAHGTKVLEVGCGTGAITRIVAEKEGVKEIIGIDPSSIFIEKAKELNQYSNASYFKGDGGSLPFDEDKFDVVLFHTVLCHVPSPEVFLKEALRVLKKGGQLVIFEGDYATRSVSIGENDPLQSCVEMMKKYNCQNPWLVRKLPSIITSLGMNNLRISSYGYLGKNPSYMINYINRGVERLAEVGIIGQETATILSNEAHQRVKEGRFFGYFPLLGFIAEVN